MSRGTFIRILEAFFRRWYLYVLPLLVMLVLGLAAITDARDQYTSEGSVFVDSDGLVTSLSDVPDTGLASFLTPAQFASQELNGLLQTDAFVSSVLTAAGVGENSAVFWLDPVAEAQASIGSAATSENLMRVTASTPDPELSRRLATSTIDVFIDFKIQLDVAQSEASEEYFSGLAETYRQDAIDARAEVDAFLVDIPVVEAMSPEQTAQLNRLTEAETRAEETYRGTLDKVEASRLSLLQAETEVRQGLSVIDPAQLPTFSDSSLIDVIITLATYLLIGLVLMLAGPVISAMANRGVLFPDDLAHLEGINVIGVIPRHTRGEMNLRKAVAPDTSEPVVAPAAGQEASSEHAADDFGVDTHRERSRLDRLVPSTIPPQAGTRAGAQPPARGQTDPRRANG